MKLLKKAALLFSLVFMSAPLIAQKKIIAYMPTWGLEKPGIDQEYMLDHFYPESVTHLELAFLGFTRNTDDWNDPNFASIELSTWDTKNIDSILDNMHIKERCKKAGTKVMVSIAGAGGYTFVWLLEKYYNDVAKLEEMADLIAQFAIDRELDGVDIVLETWWDDPEITNSTDKGGRIRKPSTGNDQGPHNIGVGFVKLCEILKPKLKAKNLLFSATVFSSSWYGNNYDAGFFDIVDWVGVMTYDFTGLAASSPKGPHANLFDVALNSYEGQSLNQPILSVDQGFKYWTGDLPASWNHDGGFGMDGTKMLMGIPFYGFDFKSPKERGYNHLSYKEILHDYPSADVSYDPYDTYEMGGHIGLDGKDIYYDTPKGVKRKVQYVDDNNHAGVMLWQLNFDIDFYNPKSLLYNINDALGRIEAVNDSCLQFPQWDNSTLYFGGDIIHHEGVKYRALKHSTDSTPNVSPSIWKPIFNCIDITVTSNEAEPELQPYVIPNPLQDVIKFDLTPEERIEIYDVNGRRIFYSTSSHEVVNTNNWKPGIYVFKHYIKNKTYNTITVK